MASFTNWLLSQQTQNISIAFVQRRPNVFDVGSTLYKCHTNVLCLLGCYLTLAIYGLFLNLYITVSAIALKGSVLQDIG